MSMDYCVYVGPYIEFPNVEIPIQIVTNTYSICDNPTCSKQSKSQDGNFCKYCGKERVIVKKEEKIKVPIYRFLEDVESRWKYDSDNCTLIVMAVNAATRSFYFDIKYDDVAQDLSNINANEAILEIKNEFSEQVSKLENIFKSKAIFKWGIVSVVS